MATQKIQSTKNYRLFKRSDENRDINFAKHRSLERSMKKYGFLPCFPIVCHRNGDKELTVKEGQHRLAFAERLNLPVFWVEESIDFDIAEVNCTAKVWGLIDFANKFARNGLQAYQEAIEFSDLHGVPIGIAVGLLAGTTHWSNVRDTFFAGKFKVKDRAYADSVAALYVPMKTLAPVIHNARFLQACMAVCRVADFEPKRMLQNSQRCREKLVAYSTREAYLDMMEEIYNFGRKQLFGLKAAATMVMRERNPLSKARKP